MVAVIINGEVNNVNKAINPYTGKVYTSAPAYFWLIQNPTEECSLWYEDHGHFHNSTSGRFGLHVLLVCLDSPRGKYVTKPSFIPCLDEGMKRPLVKDSDEKKDGPARGLVVSRPSPTGHPCRVCFLPPAWTHGSVSVSPGQGVLAGSATRLLPAGGRRRTRRPAAHLPPASTLARSRARGRGCAQSGPSRPPRACNIGAARRAPHEGGRRRDRHRFGRRRGRRPAAKALARDGFGRGVSARASTARHAECLFDAARAWAPGPAHLPSRRSAGFRRRAAMLCRTPSPKIPRHRAARSPTPMTVPHHHTSALNNAHTRRPMVPPRVALWRERRRALPPDGSRGDALTRGGLSAFRRNFGRMNLAPSASRFTMFQPCFSPATVPVCPAKRGSSTRTRVPRGKQLVDGTDGVGAATDESATNSLA